MEQALVDHVRRGKWLDLAGDEAVDEASMRSWGESRTCRAWVIRDILRGRLVADPDPHGLRLRGARISGRLDLENLNTDVSLELNDCFLEEGVLAKDAHLTRLGLAGCQIEHATEPPFDAERLTCGVLALNGARIISHTKHGAVRLSGAHIGGQLDCAGAELRNDSGPALAADGLQVGQDMYLSGGFTATGSGERRRGPPARRPHRRPARLHRGGAAQRLRPRPGRRRPAGRPGHVPERRVHRHRQRR